MAKQIFEEATRQWKLEKVYAPLLDYFHFALPCRDDYLIRLATASKCPLACDRKSLYPEFTVPVINQTMQLMEADAFDLVFQNKNKTCRVKYTGPQHVIIYAFEQCPASINLM